MWDEVQYFVQETVASILAKSTPSVLASDQVSSENKPAIRYI